MDLYQYVAEDTNLAVDVIEQTYKHFIVSNTYIVKCVIILDCNFPSHSRIIMNI